MKTALLVVFLGLCATAFADDFDSEVQEADARFLYFNTSSTATSLTLLGALILLGVIGYLVYVGGLLGTSSYNRNDYYGQVDYQQGAYDYSQQAQYRSANDGYDYNGLDCQKRLICEVMREPEYYGNMAQKFKSGFQYAKYLEVLSLPDDMRELLDEYLDANSS